MDGIVAHSHKFRVPMGERSGRRGLQRTFESNSTPPPLVALTHASHIATRPPGCNHKDNPVDEIGEIKERDETNMLHSTSSRHKIRKPSRRDLYVTISELQLVATGRLEITCVSTIPEFRSIDDKFADVRNDTVIVDVIKPSTYIQPTTNITIAEYNTSGAQRPYSVLYIMCICLLKIA